jgi:hypothetical protein
MSGEHTRRRRACYKDDVSARSSSLLLALVVASSFSSRTEARPRLNAALGMGASFEPSGFSPARTEAVPAFFATGGVGDDWPVGVELAAFATSASGRFRTPDAPVDRLALAGLLVLRPYAFDLGVSDELAGARALRTLGFELGAGLERDGTTVRAGSRWGLHTGVRFEIPLAGSDTKELRLRLAGRRMWGLYTPRVGDVDVGNGLELYAALVTSF